MFSILLSVVSSLTQAEIDSCSANCNSLTGQENLDCRSKCAQVPFGGTSSVNQNAQCQKNCGSDQTCYNSCTAQYITGQNGSNFVSSKNNGIPDKLVVGNSSIATPTNSSLNSSAATTATTSPTSESKTVSSSAAVSMAILGAIAIGIQ